jgi:hypothetical protein
MANLAAAKFLKQLIGAIARFPVSVDTKEIYLAKISKWYLRQDQWDKALDILIQGERRQDENIPSLSEIYTALKNAQYSNSSVGNGALATFDLPNGYSGSMRVINYNGVWVIADAMTRDSHGGEVHHQKYIGEAFALHIPEGAINVQVYPDNPADPKPEEIASSQEVAKLVNEAIARLKEK